MVKKNEEKTPIDYPVEQRQEGWSPAIRGAVSGFLLVALGGFFGYLGWVGLSTIGNSSNIAVLVDSDKSTRVHIVTSEKRSDAMQNDITRIDTEVRNHNKDVNRHK